MSTDRESEIEKRAHALWENDGKPDGEHLRHWHQAAAEIDHAEQSQQGDGATEHGNTVQQTAGAGAALKKRTKA